MAYLLSQDALALVVEEVLAEDGVAAAILQFFLVHQVTVGVPPHPVDQARVVIAEDLAVELNLFLRVANS